MDNQLCDQNVCSEMLANKDVYDKEAYGNNT